jgi:uncharacterized protein (TIGR02996 family)
MNDEAAFLAALAASPDDDLLRLAFADWLDERNDPRAGWVRDPEIWRHTGPDFRDPVPGLIVELGTPQRRERITRALAEFGLPAVLGVLRAMRTDNDDVRGHGQDVLAAMAPLVASCLPDLMQQLQSSDRLERLAAVEAVGVLGEPARPALPLLAGCLEEDDGPILRAAVAAVIRLGPVAAPLVPALHQAEEAAVNLDDEDLGWRIRGDIIQALGRVGPAALDAVDLLIGGFMLDGEVAEEAMEALQRLGMPVAEAVLHATVDLHSDEEDYGIGVLTHFGQEVIPLLLKTIADPSADSGVRAVALQVFAEEEFADKLGPYADEVVSHLRAALEDEEEYVRERAAAALANLGVTGSVKEHVLPKLASPDPDVRRRAVGEVRGLALEPAEIVAMLEPLLEDPNDDVRLEAVLSLRGRPGIDSGRLVRMLCEWLRTGPDYLAEQAAHWLVWMPAVSAAVPNLLAALHHSAEEVRAAAVGSLGGLLETPEVLAGLRQAARDPAVRVRHAIATVFQRRMKLPAAIAPVVLELTADPDESVRDMATAALWHVDAVPPAAVGALMSRLERDDRWGIRWTAHALARAGPTGIAHLWPLLQSERPLLRQAAAQGLAQVASPPPAALPGLLACLHDEEPETRAGAAIALGNLGPPAAEAVGALVQLLRDPGDVVRGAAAGALGKIGPAALHTVSDLLAALEDRNTWVHQFAAESLGRLLSIQAELLSRLAALWNAPEERSRAHTADILGHVSPTAVVLGDALRILRQLAFDPSAEVRKRVVVALGNLAPAVAETLPELQRLAGDPDPWVRERAADALKKVSGAEATLADRG